MSDETTPTGLEPSSDGVDEWVRYQLIRINDRIKTISTKLDVTCLKLDKFDEFRVRTEIRLAEGAKTFKAHEERLQSMQEQIRELRAIQKNNKPPKDDNSITFKWLVEKLGTPVITSIITAIIVAALVAWIAG